jgi:hypothetical protein
LTASSRGCEISYNTVDVLLGAATALVSEAVVANFATISRSRRPKLALGMTDLEGAADRR